MPMFLDAAVVKPVSGAGRLRACRARRVSRRSLMCNPPMAADMCYYTAENRARGYHGVAWGMLQHLNSAPIGVSVVFGGIITVLFDMPPLRFWTKGAYVFACVAQR